MRETKNHPAEVTKVRARWVRLDVLGQILRQLCRLGGRRVRFRKYRVAPRLGTDVVRQRLLHGIYAHARLTATETGLA